MMTPIFRSLTTNELKDIFKRNADRITVITFAKRNTGCLQPLRDAHN